MPIRRKALSVFIALFSLTSFAFATAAHASVQHTISFDDYDALYWTVGQSRLTFAVPSKDTGIGKAVSCDPSTESCWWYAQLTWDASNNYGYYYVNPEYDGHYHLGFENDAFYNPGCFVDPNDGDGSGFGLLSGSTCQAVDWAAQPRYVSPHDEDEWFETFADGWHEYDATEIWNRGDVPIQVWVLGTDWNWYYWDNLAGNTVWDISSLAWSIYELDISAGSAQPGIITIDDLKITYN